LIVNPLMDAQLIGLIGGFTSTSAALPQVYKCILTGRTKDLTYVTNVVSYIGSSMCIYYGISIGQNAIVACNAYALVVNTTLLCTKLYFEVLCTGTKDYTPLENQTDRNGAPVLRSVHVPVF